MRLGQSKGVTLLELLLVLAILAGSGFALSVKLPANLQNQRLNISSTLLLEDLRDTRQAAMAENTWYSFKFFQQDRFYRISRQGVKVRDVRLQDGVMLLNTPPDLIFNAEGTPSVGLTILLGTSGGDTKKVIVAPVNGRIREE